MILQLDKHVFSLTDRYTISDELGNPIYQVHGHLFTFGKKLELLDMTGNELAKIQQRVFSLQSEYDILQGDQVTMIVKKELFSFLHPRFTVEGVAGSYEMEGDWLNWNSEIRTGGTVVARISQKFAIFQDKYGMEITDGADVPLLICLAIVMDEIAHPKNN